MDRSSPSRIRPLLCGLVAAAALLAFSAPPAFAHAYLEASSPAPAARELNAPGEVAMRFDEALNRHLSTAAIYNSQTDRRESATVSFPGQLEMILRPTPSLPRGSYRVEWHSVSAVDGHEVEGSFSFGVQAPAIGGAVPSVQSPLAGLGWLRALIRTGMYLAVFLFAGAVMLRTLLGRHGEAVWILPAMVRERLDDQQAAALARRERTVVSEAGMLAVALAAASALIDTRLAAGNLSGSSIHAYLLSNTPGLARVGLVVLLAVALSGAVIGARASGIVAALALGDLALSGHADSASPRGLAVAVGWLHLLGGAVWLGGIALLALVWLPQIRRAEPELRRAVMAALLPRFGRVALPAFVLVALTGLVNAYVEVRHPSLLWDSSYGRVLLVKSMLVTLIALISYRHAFRLRPRLIAANPHPDETLERRHWRLIGTEPLLGVAVAVAVAILVSFGSPAQVAAHRTGAAQPLAACNPCVLPLPAANQLSVATHVGSDLVAAWLERRSGRLQGQVRVLDLNGQPSTTRFEIADASSVSLGCGVGCRGFALDGAPALLRVILNPDRGPETASFATRWQPTGSSMALRILLRAQATMRRLHSVRDTEQVNSVPGFGAIIHYRMQAPNRLAYVTYAIHQPGPPQLQGQAVEIGARSWVREPGARWQQQPPEGTLPFATNAWFIWSTYAQATRLIDQHSGRRLATIELMDPGTPAWWTLVVDLGTQRVLSGTLLSPGHFETERFDRFNRTTPIIAPIGRRP